MVLLTGDPICEPQMIYDHMYILLLLPIPSLSYRCMQELKPELKLTPILCVELEWRCVDQGYVLTKVSRVQCSATLASSQWVILSALWQHLQSGNPVM